MNEMRPDPAPSLDPLTDVIGEWWLRGYADAYAAHWAVVPSGRAGEQYLRGYALGVAAVRELYFCALNRIGRQQVAVPLEC